MLKEVTATIRVRFNAEVRPATEEEEESGLLTRAVGDEIPRFDTEEQLIRYAKDDMVVYIQEVALRGEYNESLSLVEVEVRDAAKEKEQPGND